MNAIELRGLEKSYEGFHLGPLDLDLPAGCILGLVGENGAGKSTTIRALLGIIRPDAGTAAVLGAPVGPDMRQAKQDMGVVLDEVGFPAGLRAGQISRIMAAAYKNWDQSLFEKYLRDLDIPTDKKFSALSRGNRMKMGIAAALSHDAKLLILDEPTGGLDPVVRDEVVGLFSDFTRDPGHSILISSHIVSDLEKLCDYIAFLHKGQLLLCEEKDRLLEEYGLIQCDRAFLEGLAPGAVRGKRETPYHIEALVRRDAVPAGTDVRPVTIEELFVLLVKGDMP